MIVRILIATSAFLLAVNASAQGQDSTPSERDTQVVAELLHGIFDNANQAYFDYRTGVGTKHRRIHAEISRISAPELGEFVFVASTYWDNDDSADAGEYLWVLSADNDAQAVRMRSRVLQRQVDADAMLDGDALAEQPSCDLLWRRESTQFRGQVEGDCDLPLPTSLLLSDKHLWLRWAEQEGGAYQLHRARSFECYADIPGVGGGGDIPYDRYEGFRIHDQGGLASFTSKEGRELSISLLLVDWPINNYEGVFTRDSLVIYVNEQLEEGRKSHGYAFTVPEADRVGINLQWMLAFCYVTSNKDATPYL